MDKKKGLYCLIHWMSVTKSCCQTDKAQDGVLGALMGLTCERRRQKKRKGKAGRERDRERAVVNASYPEKYLIMGKMTFHLRLQIS